MHLFAAALFAAISVQDSAPRPIEQLVRKSWSPQDGAPAGIRVLAQTRDGYLWLGTVFGLVRFDGVRFTPFAPRGNDTLPDRGVRELLASRDGTLWIVWESGAVSHMVDGRLTSFGTGDGLAPVFRLAESSRGELVAGTETGLARFTDGKWTDVASEWGFTGTRGRAVWFDMRDALWVETTDRIVYRPLGATGFVDPGQMLKAVAWQADFAEAADGTIWIAELDRSAHTLRRAGENTPVTEVRVGTFALLIDRKGSLWIGSNGDGLRRALDPSRIRGRSISQFGSDVEHFTEKEGLLSNFVWDLLEDREGNIWVASTRGLERFREGSLVPLATGSGHRPRTVFPARDSSVWTSTFPTREVTRFGLRSRDDLHAAPCWCSGMAQDSSGAIWAFDDTEVVRFRGLTPTKVHFQGGPLLGIAAIAIDPSGTVWISDRSMGLVRVIGNRLDPVVSSRDLGSVTALMSDRTGRIWGGAGNRVILYDHGTLRGFGATDGLKSGQITDVYEDRAGDIWAVGSGGITKFDGLRFKTLSERQTLPGRAVFAMREDDVGAWWLAMPTGLVRLEPGELERAMADTSHSMRYRTFDRLDGLPGAITITKFPALARSLDGRIWVAADEGVAFVDPRQLGRRDVALNVLVETVRVDGRESAPADVAAVPSSMSDLEIDYTATVLSNAEHLQFRYRLDGADTAWREVDTRRRAYYTGLAPGSYRFRVSANRGDGHWDETGATWSFRVIPAWYQTGSFKALMVLLIGSFGGLVVWLVQRRRYLRSQSELKRHYEVTMAERARIADDLHDTLLQGFAGINLQLIAAELALPTQPEVAAQTILRVQRLTEESLREARNRVWEMRDGALVSDDLATALETVARDRTAAVPIEVVMTTAGNSRRLPPPIEDASFRIGREAIVNAVRHAEASRIEVHLDFRAHSLYLEVRDNGRGVSQDEMAEARKHGHFGLSGIQNRASRMGGRCEVDSRVGGGTTVKLELPLSLAPPDGPPKASRMY